MRLFLVEIVIILSILYNSWFFFCVFRRSCCLIFLQNGRPVLCHSILREKPKKQSTDCCKAARKKGNICVFLSFHSLQNWASSFTLKKFDLLHPFSLKISPPNSISFDSLPNFHQISLQNLLNPLKLSLSLSLSHSICPFVWSFSQISFIKFLSNHS